MGLASRSVNKAGVPATVTVIISMPGFSGELWDGFGRVTDRVGNAMFGSGPVVKVVSGPERVSPPHCTWARIWYVVDARIPATRIEDLWYEPGRGDQVVLRP